MMPALYGTNPPNEAVKEAFAPVVEWLTGLVDQGNRANPDIPKFDMTTHYNHNECGTACCLAGAIGIFHADRIQRESTENVVRQASERGLQLQQRISMFADEWLVSQLGMDPADATDLFYTEYDNTPAEGLRKLKHYLDTGDVLPKDHFENMGVAA